MSMLRMAGLKGYNIVVVNILTSFSKRFLGAKTSGNSEWIGSRIIRLHSIDILLGDEQIRICFDAY